METRGSNTAKKSGCVDHPHFLLIRFHIDFFLWSDIFL
jgi:hypothetical protein